MNSDDAQSQYSPEPIPSPPAEGTIAAQPLVERMGAAKLGDAETLRQEIRGLEQRKQALQQELETLQKTYQQQLQAQIAETQATMNRLIQEGLSDLEQRRQTLQITVEQLERRQERIRTEMRTTFAGASQDLAIRVQGFKDYLVGSLQDLVNAAEQLRMVPEAPEQESKPSKAEDDQSPLDRPNFGKKEFAEDTEYIQSVLDRYRNKPEYYGPPWKLRRTFEPVHAERVLSWFSEQSGRGALRSMGSRLQNILIASAIVSILRDLYEDQLRTLVLANSPERLGEWRRGLQDCLGITRADFGPDQGVILFETAEAVTQKAERILKQGDMPLIIVDESEDQINLSLLQFPLWLAFAPDPQAPSFSFR